MKRILSLILAMIFAVSIVSCTITPIDSTTNNTTADATTVATESTTAESTESTTGQATTTVVSTESTTTPVIGIPDDPDDNIEQPEDNADFAILAKDFFIEALMGDGASEWNTLFDDPISFGYERDPEYTPSFPFYDGLEGAEEDIEYYQNALLELKKFDYAALNRNQQIEYRQIEFNSQLMLQLLNNIDTWAILAVTAFIDSYGGGVASAVSTLENYKLKTKGDVDDLVSYIESAKDAFETYITYGNERIARGFEIPDTTIDGMMEFLDGILSQGEDYYLYEYLAKQINKTEFLTDSEKEAYIQKMNDGLTNIFFPACATLKENLPSLKGHWDGLTSTSVAHYGEKAKGYLDYKLANAFGTLNVDAEKYGEELLKLLVDAENEYNAVIREIQAQGSTFVNRLVGHLESTTSFLGCKSDEDLLKFCLEYAQTVVYPLPTEPTIELKYTDESIGEYAQYVAYYMLSPLDTANSLSEYITTNPAQIAALSDALGTLAHEGYPGHLYDHVYKKQKGITYFTVANSLSGSEAWAQYASYALLMNAAESLSNNYYKLECKYLAAMSKYNYLFSNYIEYACNYLCLDIDGLVDLFGGTRKDALSNIQYSEDNVAGLVGYGYAFGKMCAIHDAIEKTTPGFVEMDFNRYILNNNGTESISRYEELAKNYVQP